MSSPVEYGHVGMGIRHTHPYGFRTGEWGKITGVRYMTREDGESRWVYDVVWPDGVTDTPPVFDDLEPYEFRQPE